MLPDNRIIIQGPKIDFANQVGVTGQSHDTYPAPGQARYDLLRSYLIGLLSNQSSFDQPNQFRSGTLWFNLNNGSFEVQHNGSWVGLAEAIVLDKTSGMTLADWFGSGGQLPSLSHLISDLNSYSDPTWLTSLSASKITGTINIPNGVVTTGSYPDPAWIPSLSGSKLTGTVTATNGVVTTGTYADPAWIVSLAGSKLTGTVTATNGVVTTGSYTDPAWIVSLAGSKLSGTVTATNGVVTTGTYADPAWITSLSGSKLSGTVTATNGVVTTGSYTDPAWIVSLAGSKLSGTVTATNGVVTTGSYADPAWITSLAGSKLSSVPTGILKGASSALAAAVAGTDYPGLATANTFTQTQIAPVQDKGGAIFHVKAYGAVGDNSHDDTTNIQAAINAANSAGGGRVVFPAGHYKITGSLTIYNSVELHGMGAPFDNSSNFATSPGAWIMWAGGNVSTPLIVADSISAWRIERLGIMGGDLGSTSVTIGVKILATTTANTQWVIEHCHISGCGTAIVWGDGSNSEIDQARIADSSFWSNLKGLNISGPNCGDNSQIFRCNFLYSGGSGNSPIHMDMLSHGDLSIKFCTGGGPSDCTFIRAGNNGSLTIENCEAEGCQYFLSVPSGYADDESIIKLISNSVTSPVSFASTCRVLAFGNTYLNSLTINSAGCRYLAYGDRVYGPQAGATVTVTAGSYNNHTQPYALNAGDWFTAGQVIWGVTPSGAVPTSGNPAATYVSVGGYYVSNPWAGTTGYLHGTLVMPTTDNGFVYQATSGTVGNTAGTTGSSQPFPTVWAASHSYANGTLVVPTKNNGFVFQATQVGTATSGSTEPTWPTTLTNTVVDGGVTWTCFAVAVGETFSDGTVTWTCSGTSVQLRPFGMIGVGSASTFPTVASATSGMHSVGEVLWNSAPGYTVAAGWICITAGNPGTWMAFGPVTNQLGVGVASPLNVMDVRVTTDEVMRFRNNGGKLEFFCANDANNAYAALITNAASWVINTTSNGTVTFGTGTASFGGAIQVGGGALVQKILSATATLDFPSTTAQTSADLTIAVTGANVGDSVSLGLPASPSANTAFTGFVSASGTVTVRFHNYSSGAVDPASGTYRATVHSF